MSRDLDDRYDDDSARSRRDRFQEAKASVSVPAVLLIVIGALGLLYSAIEIINRDSTIAKFDEMSAQIEADPKITREQKDFWVNMFNSAKDTMQSPITLVFYIGHVIGSLLVMIGGIKMLQLSGPAFPTIGSVLALTPCIGCCCVPGLPIGIWALVVLNRPIVRAAMASRNAVSQEQDMDDQDLR